MNDIWPKYGNWSGLPFLSPGDLPNPGTESKSLAGGFLPLSHLGSLCQSRHNPIHKSSEGKGDFECNWIVYSLILRNFCLFLGKGHAVAPVDSHLGPHDPDPCGHCCKVDYDTVQSEVPMMIPISRATGTGNIWKHNVAREITEISNHLFDKPWRFPAAAGMGGVVGVPSIPSNLWGHLTADLMTGLAVVWRQQETL